MPTVATKPIHAVDFGTGAALAIHGPDGPIAKRDLKLPRVVGGRTPRDEFRMVLEALFAWGDVVVESPTVGSSGAEVGDVEDVLTRTGGVLWTISARAVKNYRMDFKLPNPKSYPKYMTESDKTQEEAHVLDAEILYRIAVDQPWRLRRWHLADEVERMHTSVRPMDKRGYRDDRAEQFMAKLPAFALLPAELREVLGNGKDYSRSLVMPFAMALTEPYWRDGPGDERRRRFEKVLGLYEHGYPSFYRRMTVTWMQLNAKRLAGVGRMEEVPRDVRKQAWRMTQRQIRWLFHLSS